MNKDHVKDAPRPSLTELEKASQALKEKILAERRKSDMPINSSLGDPSIDARNADGRNDIPDLDDD